MRTWTILSVMVVASCARGASPARPGPAVSSGSADYAARLSALVDRVPEATPPPQPKPCPHGVRGNLFLLDYELALRIRDKTGMPPAMLLDHDEAVYDLVTLAAGQPTKPGADQRVAQLQSRTPAFLRITEMSLPAEQNGRPVDGKLSAAIFVLDASGTVTCQVAFNLRSREQGAKPESPEEFGATATSALLQVLQDL